MMHMIIINFIRRVDVPRMFGLKMTQPDKVRMFETDDPDWQYVMPLLIEMETSFGKSSADMESLLNSVLSSDSELRNCGIKSNDIDNNPNHCFAVSVQSGVFKILTEINDGISLLSLRAKQIRMLYEANAQHTSHDHKAQLLTESRLVISQAQFVVANREKAYRVPWERIGSWRENPTVYRFGYLWAVHSLFYWWRDQGLAERGSLQSHYSPCYLNRMDASEVAIGWGKYTLELLRNIILNYSPASARYHIEIVNCIAPPSTEYIFPRDLYFY